MQCCMAASRWQCHQLPNCCPATLSLSKLGQLRQNLPSVSPSMKSGLVQSLWELLEQDDESLACICSLTCFAGFPAAVLEQLGQ